VQKVQRRAALGISLITRLAGQLSRFTVRRMEDRLRSLWDFEDLDATEGRFRAELRRDDAGFRRAEVLTQLARVQGLRGRFDEGNKLLDEAVALAGSTPVVEARILIERGRLLRSGGDAAASLPLFESAFEVALAAGHHFLAADAAHMAAIAVPDRPAMEAWTQRGIDLALAEPEAAYWLGPLFNNLGWLYYEAGDYESALDAFQRALEARERSPGKPLEVEIARYAVGKTLRALGRPAEAAALLKQAVAWANSSGEPDAWFHEELAEDFAALGCAPEAREQAKLALALLEPDGDDERAVRLRELAS
jgi:tetratricopeptide (TPR) repeat protein